jgi:4-alpha-glucanotransferase
VYDEWGISHGYFDVAGEWHATTDDTRRKLRDAMGSPEPGEPMWFVPVGETHTLWDPCRLTLEDGTDLGEVTALSGDLPIGYHQLYALPDGPTTHLIVHPVSCPELPLGWGVTAQIYSLWSSGSWGIGDLADLGAVTGALAAAGGTAMLVSPLHQPAPTTPQQDSPYYPSSRRAASPLLIALGEPPPADLVCTADALIDRDAVWAAKRNALEELLSRSGKPSPLPDSVAIWNALCDEFGPDWSHWPTELRRPDPWVIAARLRDNREFAQRAGFHQWCQQLIDEQLQHAGAHGVALIGDLALGFAPQGADAWEYQELLALDVRIGAPPDPFNALGQEWGIPGFVPWRLRNAQYEPFIATLRATLRGMRGLRIDHVMGLFRQYWVPEGTSAADGAYVRFPADELLAIICIEATRAGAFVIGEDLGTVEDGVRDTLASRNIARTMVLWFEPEPPSKWPAAALATATTHDLPTIAGVFAGTDGNDSQRDRLGELSKASGVQDVIADTHHAVLASSARLRLLALDDICGSTNRPNLPGTVGGSNWRKRLPVPIEALQFRGIGPDPA